MTCAEFEILLCDYLDGTLDAAARQAFEQHRESCAACAELARDAAGAVSFMERTAEVDVPPDLLTRIAFEIPTGGQPNAGRAGLLAGVRKWFQPVLQPKFAMGMAMTILSFSLLGRVTGIEFQKLELADLKPQAVWAATEDRFNKTWARAVKYYEGLKVVYEVQSRLQEWTEQDEEKAAPPAAKPAAPAAGSTKQQGDLNQRKGEQ